MNDKTIFPDYQNGTVNTINSLLKHFGVEPKHPTQPVLDAALEKEFRNVVFMIFDGMGVDVLEQNLPENSFLRQHIRKAVTAVYPCTTTAAMTTYYSGLTPAEHGWAGWSLFFKEYCRAVDLFPNTDSFSGEPVGSPHAAHAVMPYKDVFTQMHEVNGEKLGIYTVTPTRIHNKEQAAQWTGVETSGALCDRVAELCAQPGEKFIFTYWAEPDSSLHSLGCYAPEIKEILKQINGEVEKLCNGLEDTLVIISADHGHRNIAEEIYLNQIPELDECLLLPPTVEPRAASLFVKPGMEETFHRRFEERFGQDFLLLTHEEVLSRELLGPGTPHKKLEDFIGTFLACATGDKLLRYETKNHKPPYSFRSHHAGLTGDEMLVPLIVAER